VRSLERTIKTCDVNVVVIVAVNVIAPAIVAALVNGNDAVAVIDAVNEHTPGRRGDIPGMRHFQKLRRAAQSISPTVAEGCGRTTRPDQAKHVTIELLERIGDATKLP